MIGQILNYCSECREPFIVGDSIESKCRRCQCKESGHLVVGNFCGRCGVRLSQEEVDAVKPSKP